MARSYLGRHAFYTAAAAILVVWCYAAEARGQGQLAAPQAAPHNGYWAAFEPYFDGDFREALADFRDAARSGINIGGTPWIDTICYHTMMGECYYQTGDLGDALDQYTAALKLYLVHANWMLRIDFSTEITPEQNVKTAITWGPSARKSVIGHFPATFSSLQGRLDNSNVLRTGGVIEPPQLHPVYVAEIIRCTAVALSRRRELMGQAAEHDALTAQLLDALIRRPGPPNHWSQSWVELELGLAYAAANKIPQAVSELQKSLLVGGQYDHPLTCVALLELGRIAFEAGKFDAAVTYCHEATVSGAIFEKYTVMEEAFRIGAEAHLLGGGKGVYPPLAPAVTAAATKESRLVHVNILTSLAEQLCSLGNVTEAAAAITQARTELGRHAVALGAIGSRVNFQAARIALHGGDLKTATSSLAAALTFQKGGSKRLFQILLADTMYKSGAISERVADLIFTDVLREPTRADWTIDPLDTLAVGIGPHPLPYEHWFDLALSRKEHDKALNIAERIKRHRFYVTQPLGGRLIALRWILEAPAETLSPEATIQRQDLLVRFPKYGELSRRAAQIKTQLQTLPIVPTEDTQIKQQAELLGELGRVSANQEAMLQLMALERVPSELAFPPLRDTKELQEQLPDGTLVFYYLITSRNVHAFAVSKDRYTSFAVAQPAKVKTDLAEMLRQMGHHDRTLPVPIDDLKPGAWKAPAERLASQLTGGTQPMDWAKYREILVIPDGVLWYLPFESIPVTIDSGSSPLLLQLPIRYAPTLALGVGDRRGNRPLARTAIVAGKLVPREDDALAAAGAEAISAAVPGSTLLRSEPRVFSSVFSSTFDRLVVLKDQDDSDKLPFGWSPLALDTGKAGGLLSDWMLLPLNAVDQVILPGFHTPAEYALKRGGTGDEIFLATCGLMASGCRTILLSRWRVGGQSTIDLVREFVQELPHEPASVAWRRSIQLARDRMLDPSLEPRLKTSSKAKSVKADHPFFWSGYMLVDTGVVPKETAEKPNAAGE